MKTSGEKGLPHFINGFLLSRLVSWIQNENALSAADGLIGDFGTGDSTSINAFAYCVRAKNIYG